MEAVEKIENVSRLLVGFEPAPLCMRISGPIRHLTARNV